MPLALTDAQLSAVFSAAAPLEVADRGPFLQAVAAALRSYPDPGDGDVHRAIRAAQRQFFDPPRFADDPPQPNRKLVARANRASAP